jgi:site-specific DNA-methyltransferase (adenine-specific)
MGKIIKFKRETTADIRGNGYTYHKGNVLEAYDGWDAPDLIISDGAYGVRGFDGDTVDETGLAEWYRPHIEAWTKASKPSTSLWFWNTEVGWATVHSLLVSFGWEYVQTVIWDKGLGHIAGNVNGKTIRQFPVVSEVSVLYRRRVMLPTEDGNALPVKEWLRHEWERSGLPLYRANEACGVKNAATRKYLTKDWLWYYPPGEAVEKMADYASQHGKPTSRPYFSTDGKTPITAQAWDSMRSPWNHRNGITNVWSRPPLQGAERIKVPGGRNKTAHLNQKPLEFMERQITATTLPGQVVWEPFGGLASASVASIMLGREAFVAECNADYQAIAGARLAKARKIEVGEEGTA